LEEKITDSAAVIGRMVDNVQEDSHHRVIVPSSPDKNLKRPTQRLGPVSSRLKALAAMTAPGPLRDPDRSLKQHDS
jgi:hypothetical protein